VAVSVSAETLARLGAELGLAAVGAAPVGPYEQTERLIRERKARGLFDTMGFTTTHPEVSCHPEALLQGARSVVAAALSYHVPGPEPEPGEGRLPRYAWSDRYGELRAKLEALGERLGGSWRVLVDDNAHVDREAAVRAGIGFYGKSTMLIAPGLGTWIVLGTLVTTAEVEPGEPVPPGCGSCTLCIDACPTGALDDPGTLDAGLCLSWLTQRRAPIPAEQRAALGDRVYGCDICQDVCPWNRGPERRRAGELLAAGAEPVVSLVDWLCAAPAELRARYPRLYVQRNDPGVLRRNAAVALGNSGGPEHLPLLDAIAAATGGAEGQVAEHAAWAAAHLRERLAGGCG
jgi:epoxyqueuosine reductase